MPKSPPSTTIVTAAVLDGVATLGWVGDSRAYWIGAEDARQLTHDHSWVNQVVDAGQMTLEEAWRSAGCPRHHAVPGPRRRWRHRRAAHAIDPDLRVARPGSLLLCSDGLWNYASTVEQLAEFIHAAPADADAASVCGKMVEFALSQGGRDNVTVAILRV